MDDMQNINWELLKDKLQKCWDEHNSYIREFKMRNGNIVLVTKYTHTDFKIQVTNVQGVIVWRPTINGPQECYDTIYSLLTK